MTGRTQRFLLTTFCAIGVLIACSEKRPPPLATPSPADDDGDSGSGGASASGGAEASGGMEASGGQASGGMGGDTNMRTDDAFCEDPAMGGMGGGSCDDPVAPEVVNEMPEIFRYDLDLDQKIPVHFSRPVCGASDYTVLVARGLSTAGSDIEMEMTFDGVPGEYTVDLSASDWLPYDQFQLAVRRGVTDATCVDEALAQEFGFNLIACHPDGWPTAGWPDEPACRAAPGSTLDKTDCNPEAATLPAPLLEFTCGKAVAEGTMVGTPPAANPSDPMLDELNAHTYRVVAPETGTYEITLDGSSRRDITIGDFKTLTAEQTCDTVSCETLKSVIQLDLGTACGDNDIAAYADYDGSCEISETIQLTKGEELFFTVRPDLDGGCGPNKDESCDYDYTLWIKAPSGN